MRRLVVLTASVAVALVAVLASASSQAATQGRWVITDLGTLGGPGSVGYCITQRGQVVGRADTKEKDKDGYPISHAFLWENGKMRDLGTLGGPGSAAVSMNNQGQIVGTSDTKAKNEGYGHAFLWENGKMRDLGIPESSAVSINDRGQILGWFYDKNSTQHAFLWKRGKLTDLGQRGCCGLEPIALNERGQVIGSYAVLNEGTGEDSRRAFLWQNGTVRDLGTLGGKESEAYDINERGQVVGWSDRTIQASYAFLWQNGTMRDLGVLSSTAYDISESGQIVGFGVRGAFLWEKGKMTYFRMLGGSDARAYGINERGQVVGEAETKATWMDNGIRRAVKHAFLWQNGTMIDLGTLGVPRSQSYAWGIADDGQIVGQADTGKRYTHGDRVSHAVLWTYKP